jgi:hypothetical protein
VDSLRSATGYDLSSLRDEQQLPDRSPNFTIKNDYTRVR